MRAETKRRILESILDACGFPACTHPDCGSGDAKCATDYMRERAFKVADAAFNAGRIAKAKPVAERTSR